MNKKFYVNDTFISDVAGINKLELNLLANIHSCWLLTMVLGRRELLLIIVKLAQP